VTDLARVSPPALPSEHPSTAWKDHLRVVLVSKRNPLNIEAAGRAMANFGFARLRVVNPDDVAFR
jgi:tRNA/rRNA methyltransferase